VANSQEPVEALPSARPSDDLASDLATTDSRATAASTPSGESRAELLVFRLRLSIAVVSIPFAIGFAGPYLYFDALIRTIGRWCGIVEYVTQLSMLAIGSIVLNMACAGPPDRTWLGREVLGTGGVAFLRFSIGYAAVVGIIALMLVAMDARFERAVVRRWMTQYFRVALVTVMLVYAVAKVVPTQFGFLTPADLITPYGARSGFWALWDFMAASTGYTIFSGLSELAGSLLLCFRRTSVLGGLVIAGVMLNVLALNIAYNINAIGAATTIFAMDLALIGPALPSVFRFLLGARAEPVELPGAVVRTSRRGAWVLAKLGVLSLMVAALARSGIAQLRDYHGIGQPWFGAYDVTAFNARGAVPDSLRWIRVASDGRYGRAGGLGLRIQTADDRWHRYLFRPDSAAHVLMLSAFDGQSAPLSVRYATDTAGITLSTQIAGDSVTARLRPIDLQRYAIFREW